MKNNMTPEIRFPRFMDNWEAYKIKNFSENTLGGGTPRTTTKEYWGGNIEWIQSSDLNEHQVSAVNAKNKITESGLKNSATKLVPKNSLAIVTRVGVGKIALMDHEYATSQDFISLSNLKVDKWFGVYSLYNQLQKELHKVQGTSIKGITKNELLDTKINAPVNLKEQTKIGNFFKELDETIGLQQQELDNLKQTKQVFIQKMFPKKGESAPEIRFPGFSGNWIKRKFISIVDRVKSYSLSRAVETNEFTGYKYIHYGDIHKKVADIIDESSNLPNIEAGDYELLEKGDLVLADASEDYQGIATPAVITIDTPYKLIAGSHTIALRPKHELVDSVFLYYFLNSSIFKRYGYKVGTGMKVFGISVTNLLKFEGVFPTVEEQTKIGNFFKQLDETIALYQQELNSLQETKKAFLQKMFV